MKNIVVSILITILFFSCVINDGLKNLENQHSHLEYFGFAIIDTYWDDPTDSEIKTNYADEINRFSNLGDMLVLDSNDNIVQRTQHFQDLGLKAVLHFHRLLFEFVDSNSPSGANYSLRPDYQERWNEFKTINASILTKEYIGAFYIGEEPTWNGITFLELDTIAKLLKSDFPEIPLLIIEAYPSLKELEVPELVDWIGFNRYFTKNPMGNSQFIQDWNMLKSKLSNPQQRIMIIMDTHYISWAHGDIGNIDLSEMNQVANNYYELAKSEEKVIGILGYFWPNGFDTSDSIGARGMPRHVRSDYEQIGRAITGK